MKPFSWDIQYVEVGSVETGATIPALVFGERGSGRGRWRAYLPISRQRDSEHFCVISSRTGKPRLAPGGEGDLRWLIPISTRGASTPEGEDGQLVPLSDPERIEIIAHGYGGLGPKGEQCKYDEYLLAVEPQCWFRIKPSGGEGNQEYYLFADHHTVRILDREDLPALFEHRPFIGHPSGEFSMDQVRHWLPIIPETNDNDNEREHQRFHP